MKLRKPWLIQRMWTRRCARCSERLRHNVLPASCRKSILEKQVGTAGKMRGSTLLAHLPWRVKGALICGRMNFFVQRSELRDLYEKVRSEERRVGKESRSRWS